MQKRSIASPADRLTAGAMPSLPGAWESGDTGRLNRWWLTLTLSLTLSPHGPCLGEGEAGPGRGRRSGPGGRFHA